MRSSCTSRRSSLMVRRSHTQLRNDDRFFLEMMLMLLVSACTGSGFRSLAEKEIVEYDLDKDTENRPKAINVTGPGGAPVKGAPKPRPRYYNRKDGAPADGSAAPAAAAAGAPAAAAGSAPAAAAAAPKPKKEKAPAAAAAAPAAAAAAAPAK